MNEIIKQNLIDSYQADGGFIVHTSDMLEKICREFSIDPAVSLDRRLFDIEGVSHFFQHGVVSLFRKMEIRPHDKVLSLGEGNGAPSRVLAKMVGCRIVGVDINPDQVEKSRNFAVLHKVEDKVTYVLQNVEELHLQETGFTKAYCNETTCHWEDKRRAFRRICDHLIPHAKIGINEWLRGEKGSLNDAYVEEPEFRPLYKEGIWFQEDLDAYRGLLEEAGFRILVCEDCTEKVDRRMAARLKEVRMKGNPYERAMGTSAKVNGETYYAVMLKTHFTYLKYGVIIAEKG